MRCFRLILIPFAFPIILILMIDAHAHEAAIERTFHLGAYSVGARKLLSDYRQKADARRALAAAIFRWHMPREI